MVAVLQVRANLAPQTHTKKERKYQDKLVKRINKRLENRLNSSHDAAFKHVIMQELLRMQDEIDTLTTRLATLEAPIDLP